MSDEGLQLWVRNDKGQVFGPLGPTAIELLLDNGIIQGRVQLSTDGLNYVYPGRAPGLRMIFPRELWGDTVVPGDEMDAQWKQVSLPPPLPAVGSDGPSAPAGVPGPPPGGPVTAGPGARVPAAGPGARAPVAGPGARAPVGRGPPPARPPHAPPHGPVGVPHAGAPASTPSGPAFAIVPPPGANFRSSPSGVAPPPVARPAVAGPPQPAAPPRSSPSTPAAVAGTGDMPPSGSLLTHGAMELYYLAAGGNLTGRLTLRVTDRAFEVWFKKGSPQYVESSHPDDGLEAFLLREGLCQPAQLAQAHQGKAQFGGDLLTALFAMGLVNPNTAFQQLAQRALVLLGHALLAENGSFSWVNEELPAAKSMPLGNRWAAYLEQLRKTPFAELQRRMQPAMNLPVMRSGGLVPMENVRLLPQEARALTFFDGVRSLAQLIADLPSEADTLLSTAWMLKPLELVSFADTPVAAPPPSRAAVPPPPVAVPVAPVAPVVAAVAPPPPMGVPRPPAAGVPGPPPGIGVPGPPPGAVRAPGNPVMPQVPKMSVPYPGQKPSSPKPGVPAAAAAPRPAAPPTVGPPAAPRPPVVTVAPANVAPPPPVPMGAAAEAEVKQLTALFAQMKKQTLFEVLGVKKEADAGAVKIAYFKLAKSYHPDTVAPGTPEALAKAKADIFALVGEANRVLSDPKLRADYVAELDAGGTGEKVDVSLIFQAEEFFQKGCILVKARKFADAVKMLDDAIKANGDEGEYYVWRGYAKFFGFPDRKLGQTEAMKDITHGLKKNPNVAAAQFFIGMMAKLNGDNAAAKKAFQQCVKMDPQHIDAQRELRMMK